MFSSLVTLLFLAINTYLIAAQVVGPGKCPKVDSKKDFNIDKFLGKWYEVLKFYTVFEIKCSEATYTKDSNTGEIKVNNKGIERVPPPEMFKPLTAMKGRIPPRVPHPSLSQEFSDTASNKGTTSDKSSNSATSKRRRDDELLPSTLVKEKAPKSPHMAQYPLKDLPKFELVDMPTEVNADIVIPDPNEPARFLLNVTRGPQTDFQIVDTDYNSYAIIWSCHYIMAGNVHAQFSSIISRQRTTDDEILEKTKKTMSAFGVDMQQYEVSDQKNCPNEIKVPARVQGRPPNPVV